MSYVDGFVAAVPTANRERYTEVCRKMGALFKQYGATQVADCWGAEVPDGKVTSFPKAVQCKEDETVVFSWIVWPSREARETGMDQFQKDPVLAEMGHDMPFDGGRLIFASFDVISQY